MTSTRAAHGALVQGRKKLQAATREVDGLVKDVASGRSALCRTPAEEALKRRRDLVVEYNKLTRALKAAAAALGEAKAALDQLDGKLASSS
ncbi:hypothetical protein [Pseudonocardia sp. 73-21]|uniref:hypothetical protein n=1 Tax=Pseudonocardia sp. 73-21 TaxID=1895809 RepID=UPI0026261A9E|nr:hypothetical protein [Pseudonocardia sp. 73-21]